MGKRGWKKDNPPFYRDSETWTFYNEYGTDMVRIYLTKEVYKKKEILYHVYLSHRGLVYIGDFDKYFTSREKAFSYVQSYMKKHKKDGGYEDKLKIDMRIENMKRRIRTEEDTIL
jgi:hypothetical protein